MKKFAHATLLALFASLVALSAFAQSNSGTSGTNGDNRSTSSSGSNSNSNVTITNNSTNRPQFIDALPGVAGTAGVIPAWMSDDQGCKLYSPPPERDLAMKKAHAMAAGSKISTRKMQIDVWDPNTVPENDDDIYLVDWDATQHAYPGDQFLGSLVIPGKYHYPTEEALGPAIVELKRRTHTRRILVMNCPEKDNHTSGISGGLGGAWSGVPGGGSNGYAASLGISGGSTHGKVEQTPVLEIYAMNDGPVTAPRQKQKEPEAPENKPAPAPEPQQAPPPAPTPAPILASAPTIAVDPCSTIPALTIEFIFDHPRPGETWIPSADDREKIVGMAAWLKDRPMCKVQVQGHASYEASYDYNMTLGDRRAVPVYKLLHDLGVPDAQVEHASLGKYFPKGDYAPENRRVIFVVQGAASGK